MVALSEFGPVAEIMLEPQEVEAVQAMQGFYGNQVKEAASQLGTKLGIEDQPRSLLVGRFAARLEDEKLNFVQRREVAGHLLKLSSLLEDVGTPEIIKTAKQGLVYVLQPFDDTSPQLSDMRSIPPKNREKLPHTTLDVALSKVVAYIETGLPLDQFLAIKDPFKPGLFGRRGESNKGVEAPDASLDLALSAVVKLSEARMSTYIPTKDSGIHTEETTRPAKQTLQSARHDHKDRTPLPGSDDTLRLKLVEQRRARNATEHQGHNDPQAQPRSSVSSSRKAVKKESRVPTSDLFNRLAGGDLEAREVLIERSMPLASWIANRYPRNSVLFEDIEQVAHLALVKAVDRFDPSKGVAFSTYAEATISGEIKRYFRDYTWGTHVPRSLQELAIKVAKEMHTFDETTTDSNVHKNGIDHKIRAIAEKLNVSYESAVEAWEAANDGHYPNSLDMPIKSDGDSGEDTVMSITPSNHDEENITIESMDAIEELKRTLAYVNSARDRRIFFLRMVCDMKQKDVARIVGVSQMQVSRIVQRIKDGTYRSGGKNLETVS
jgi:RNA polymerase sigma-B factor